MTSSDVCRLSRARLLANGEGRDRRVAARLSLRELAAAIGTDAATLSNWEAGTKRPRVESALRWLDVLEELAAAPAVVGGEAA